MSLPEENIEFSDDTLNSIIDRTREEMDGEDDDDTEVVTLKRHGGSLVVIHSVLEDDVTGAIISKAFVQWNQSYDVEAAEDDE